MRPYLTNQLNTSASNWPRGAPLIGAVPRSSRNRPGQWGPHPQRPLGGGPLATGRRDRTMLTLAAQSGLRASELTGSDARTLDRHRSPRQLPRQGPKAADHPADTGDRDPVVSLARREAGCAGGSSVPGPRWRAAQPRRPGAEDRPARRDSISGMPLVGGEEGDGAHPAPHRRERLLLAGVDTSVIAL